MGLLRPVKRVGGALLHILFFLESVTKSSYAAARVTHRKAPWEHLRLASTGNRFGISLSNLSCHVVPQPLNHFHLPRDQSPIYFQRYCVYNHFIRSNSSNAPPVLFYTGNESPLDEYVNNTGLIWELAEELHAQVIFAEHRYEGTSLPAPNIPNCMAYSSSVQAIADYAFLIERLYGNETGRPVIAFGGSYGGMLSAWLRMKYPHLVVGAVAASAPIWGLPRNFPDRIDAAWRVVKHGLEQSYPPTLPKHSDNYCASNLLASWPLMQVLGESEKGKGLLTESFRLCEPLVDVSTLIEWAQSPWFDLAEGSFPYPSGYIVFALTHNEEAKLPAWPLQAACWNVSQLHRDMGIRFQGSTTNVTYSITYGSNLTINVDWDNATASKDWENDVNLEAVRVLLENVRNAVSIWFNVTKDVPCYNLTVAPNLGAFDNTSGRMKTAVARDLSAQGDSPNRTEMCQDRMVNSGSWPSICCNDEMNLIITEARGLGNDVFWPPSHPRGTRTHADVIASAADNLTDSYCSDPDDIYGYPKSVDPWSTYLDVVYGGTRIKSHSNIIFSNGLLDPWSAAGVYYDESSSFVEGPVPGLRIYNVSHQGSLALIMDLGGHHTDLMYSSVHDPPSIAMARQIEKAQIQQWIQEWQQQRAAT